MRGLSRNLDKALLLGLMLQQRGGKTNNRFPCLLACSLRWGKLVPYMGWQQGCQEDLEKEMSVHCSICCLGNSMDGGAWWAGLLSVGSQRVRQDLKDLWLNNKGGPGLTWRGGWGSLPASLVILCAGGLHSALLLPPALQKRQLGFWSLHITLSIICPNHTCTWLFLVSYTLFSFCYSRGYLSRCKHCSKWSRS